MAGVGLFLKQRKPSVKIILADPPGSVLFSYRFKLLNPTISIKWTCTLNTLLCSYVKEGKLERSGSSITEGIGQGRITQNLKDAPIDDALQVPDEETSTCSPLSLLR